MEAGGIILAGGQSRRMQQNKALLELGDKKMIEIVAEKLLPPCQELIISTNSPEIYTFMGYTTVRDQIPDRGPLSGIHAALKASRFDYNFVVSCDMVFVNRELVKLLLEASRGHDVTVPKLGELYEPLHGVYHKNCIPFIERQLKEGKGKVSAFYDHVKAKFLGKEELGNFDLDLIFHNLNTPEEFKRAEKSWGQQ